MNLTAISDYNESVPAHPTEFYDMVDRLKAERKELYDLLTQIEEKAQAISGISNGDVQIQSLRDLLAASYHLFKTMKTFANLQRKEVYPFLIQYFNLSAGPSIRLSFWKLEKDLELAENDMESFMDAINPLTFTADAKPLNVILVQLAQAYRLMREYLREDDLLITPLAEKVLTDIDYLYS